MRSVWCVFDARGYTVPAGVGLLVDGVLFTVPEETAIPSGQLYGEVEIEPVHGGWSSPISPRQAMLVDPIEFVSGVRVGAACDGSLPQRDFEREYSDALVRELTRLDVAAPETYTLRPGGMGPAVVLSGPEPANRWIGLRPRDTIASLHDLYFRDVIGIETFELRVEAVLERDGVWTECS